MGDEVLVGWRPVLIQVEEGSGVRDDGEGSLSELSRTEWAFGGESDGEAYSRGS